MMVTMQTYHNKYIDEATNMKKTQPIPTIANIQRFKSSSSVWKKEIEFVSQMGVEKKKVILLSIKTLDNFATLSDHFYKLARLHSLTLVFKSKTKSCFWKLKKGTLRGDLARELFMEAGSCFISYSTRFSLRFLACCTLHSWARAKGWRSWNGSAIFQISRVNFKVAILRDEEGYVVKDENCWKTLHKRHIMNLRFVQNFLW